MKLLRHCALSSLLVVLPSFGFAQVQVAFDPCEPTDNDPLGPSDFTSLCPEDLIGGGVIVQGASSDTHQMLAERMAFDNLMAFSNGRLAALERDLIATNLYEDITITPGIGLVEVALTEKPRVTSVEFVGSQTLDTEALATLVPLEIGSALNQQEVVAYARDILSEYQRLGYFTAAIEPFLVPSPSYSFANGVVVSIEINEGEIAQVVPIKFVGNETLSDRELLNVIEEAKTWRTADEIDIDLLSADQNNVLNAYADAGLGRTSLSIQVATYDANGNEITNGGRPSSVGLVFEIRERAFEIGEVNVVGGEEEDEAIQDAASTQTSSLQTGTVFDPELAIEEAQAISERLNETSDVDLGVSPVFEVDPATSAMNISFVVFQLPPRELISVRFVGNEQTTEAYMLQTMGLKIGDTVENSDIQDGVSKLGSTSLFQDISISEDTAPEGKLALVVTVEENKTGLQRLGATYSTKTGFSMRLGVEERNWLGRGLYAGTRANLGEKTQTLEFFFNPPSFKLTDSIQIQNQFNFTTTHKSDEHYRSNTLSWTASYNRQLPAQIVETPSLQLSSSQITHAGADATETIRADVGVLKTQAALGYKLSRSVLRSDDLPLDGSNHTLMATVTFPKTEDIHARLSASSEVYKALDAAERAVLSFRNSLDVVGPAPGGVLPTSARLKNTTVAVRGFKSGGFAPRQSSNDSVYGGTTAFGSSISLRYKLLNHPRLPIYGSLYVDAGAIYDQGSDFSYDSNGTAVAIRDSNLLRVTSGVGIVLQTDVGAITFTLSEPHVKADFDKVEELQFAFGANL